MSAFPTCRISRTRSGRGAAALVRPWLLRAGAQSAQARRKSSRQLRRRVADGPSTTSWHYPVSAARPRRDSALSHGSSDTRSSTATSSGCWRGTRQSRAGPARRVLRSELWRACRARTPADASPTTPRRSWIWARRCVRASRPARAVPGSRLCGAHCSGRQRPYPGTETEEGEAATQTTMVLRQQWAAVFLERRPEAGIWGGLWSLPEVGEARRLVHERLGSRRRHRSVGRSCGTASVTMISTFGR